jgi:GTP cyclohydrolase I
LADAYRSILKYVGEDPERPGLQKTPERIAKVMLELTKGYKEDLDGRYI